MIFIIAPATPAALGNADNRGSEGFANDRIIKRFYRSKGHAQTAIKELARKYPGEVFGIFEATTLYEAKQPEIMEKVVNETGEIVPRR